MSRVAVVIGHTQKRPGACCPDGVLPCEWTFNKKVADSLGESPYIDVYSYPPSGIGYIARVNALAEIINAREYDAVLELHYNAAGSPIANGTEALYYFNSKKGKRYAKDFCEQFTYAFPFKDRGARGLYNRSMRGFYFLQKMKAPAVILEPIFCTSPKDRSIVKECEDFTTSYSAFLYYFINNYILNYGEEKS